MFTCPKKIPVAAVVLFCILLSLVGFAESKKEHITKVIRAEQAKQAEQQQAEKKMRLKLLKRLKQQEKASKARQAEQQKPRTLINVDADVIEVEAAELYEMGVSPIGQGKDSVSVDDISRCLKEGKGEVICGVTLSVINGEQASAKQECRKFFTRGNARRGSSSLEEALSFRVSAEQKTEDKIFLKFSFEQTYYETPEEPNEVPMPPRISRDWDSYLTLEAGVPEITGHIQEGRNSYFLIMSADVKD